MLVAATVRQTDPLATATKFAGILDRALLSAAERAYRIHDQVRRSVD